MNHIPLMNISYLSIGSNLNNPRTQLKQALSTLNNINEIGLLKISPFYWNSFIGGHNEDKCLNGAIQIQTTLSPQALLETLLAIETQQGRQRITGQHCGRTLDLDILLYENEIIHSPTLTLPHPHMKKRAFVIKPLYDLNPDLILPCGEKIAEINQQLIWDGIVDNIVC